MPTVLKSGNLNLLEPSGPVQACNGIALPFLKKLVQRWKKCIEKQGDYVEKWCYCKFSVFIEIKFVSVVRIIVDTRILLFGPTQH